MIPLFEHYPLIKDKIPYVSLAEIPTPVEKLSRLGRDLGLDHLYIKRDDKSGRLFGGNKLRKLEFILGHVLRTSAKEVLTFGFAGSNHALSTAVHAKELGLRSISMLMPQLNALYVRRNLLMSYYCGAELHQYRNDKTLKIGTAYQLLRHKLKYGSFPQVIPSGGSSTLGITGYVNAAFELKEQIMKGQIPEPDCIYVALGTTGTVAGLKIGLKAAGIKSRVIPVRVIDKRYVAEKTLFDLISETVAFLRSLDPSFPRVELSARDIGIVDSFLGKGYARFTREGMEALTRMEKLEGIKLDGTYTGKTLAALFDDAVKNNLRDKVILFWNTYNSIDFSDAISAVDYHDLPRCFHRYFEEEVQPLDRIPERI
ncbi:MAG: pyridoxal-phosphate dependent enzyme [Acidobacteria bacterium]|nr:pyridoxal-phosphate dependent enzyme [Acidobacteriota bacterium]